MLIFLYNILYVRHVNIRLPTYLHKIKYATNQETNILRQNKEEALPHAEFTKAIIAINFPVHRIVFH